MEEKTTQGTTRLTDWLILAFVLVVMGLLLTDIGGNVMDLLDREEAPSEITLVGEKP